MKKIVLLFVVLIVSMNLFSMNYITLKDGRVLSGTAVKRGKTITINGNQGLFQFKVDEVEKIEGELTVEKSTFDMIKNMKSYEAIDTGVTSTIEKKQNIIKPVKIEADDEIVVIETNVGNLEVELYSQAAPKTVANFKKLINKGFYNGIIFHRVIPNFMIQTGDPDGTGKGGPGYKFEDEISAKALGLSGKKVKNDPSISRQISPDDKRREWTIEKYLESKGYKFNNDLPSLPVDYSYLAMANSGPNTNGSQFFIVTRKPGCEWLYGKHTVFGRVIKGMDIALKIESAERDKSNRPKSKLFMKKVFLSKK